MPPWSIDACLLGVLTQKTNLDFRPQKLVHSKTEVQIRHYERRRTHLQDTQSLPCGLKRNRRHLQQVSKPVEQACDKPEVVEVKISKSEVAEVRSSVVEVKSSGSEK